MTKLSDATLVAIAIPADPETPPRLLDVRDDLNAYRALVGGWVETVTCRGMIPAANGSVLIVNEEGRLRGLRVNALSSVLAGQSIVGDTVLVGRIVGDTFSDLSLAAIEAIREVEPNLVMPGANS